MPEGAASLKTVCFTGGGTAGHVMPNLAVIAALKTRHWSVFYIGSSGLEKELVASHDIAFEQIVVGKLRRYFSWENFVDIFKVCVGIVQSWRVLRRRRPDVVFSKGGFVSVPVVVAAKILRIPTFSHESDLTPGLATRLITPFVEKVLYTFEETKGRLPASAELVPTPIRPGLRAGDRDRGARTAGLAPDKATILVMGGSQGAVKINESLRDALPQLLERYQVVHITGKGKSLGIRSPGYVAFEFVSEDLADLLALADLVVSRAGSNSIFELLSLRKPMLLIPLKAGSRGDQIDNARSFVKKGWAVAIDEDQLDGDTLCAKVDELHADRKEMIDRQHTGAVADGIERIVSLLESATTS